MTEPTAPATAVPTEAPKPAPRKTAMKWAPAKKEFAHVVSDGGKLSHINCRHERTPMAGRPAEPSTPRRGPSDNTHRLIHRKARTDTIKAARTLGGWTNFPQRPARRGQRRVGRRLPSDRLDYLAGDDYDRYVIDQDDDICEDN